MAKKPGRPIGVSILAFIDAVSGTIALVTAAYSFLGLVGYTSGPVGLLDLIVGGIALPLGALLLLNGYGDWSGKRWGWTLNVALIFITIAFLILFSLGFLPSGPPYYPQTVGTVIPLGLGVLVLWYLSRPGVRAFFGRGG